MLTVESINNMPVLIAEDDPDIRESLQDLLEGMGYPVHAVTNAKEAVAWLQANPGRCVVLVDWLMPGDGDGGKEILDYLALGGEERKAVVITAMSPNYLPSHPKAEKVLSKPFNLQDLLDTVETVSRIAV
jgi:CheY-like chemotaxis protein